MFVKTVLAGSAAVLAMVAIAPAAFAGYHETIQLNSGATLNVYQSNAENKVYGGCETVDPKFSSPELTLGDLHEEPVPGTAFDLWATATLKPGVGPGTYKITMTCGNSSVVDEFTVPAPPTTTTMPPADAHLPAVQFSATGGKTYALGHCPGDKGVFSSPVLTFGGYFYGSTDGFVSATATPKPDTHAGTYKLTMTCGDKTVSTDFTLPGKQVTKTPVGAPQTGGGGTATTFA